MNAELGNAIYMIVLVMIIVGALRFILNATYSIKNNAAARLLQDVLPEGWTVHKLRRYKVHAMLKWYCVLVNTESSKSEVIRHTGDFNKLVDRCLDITNTRKREAA